MDKYKDVKKFLKIKKNDLILLAVYKEYGKEFEDIESASEYIRDLIKTSTNVKLKDD